jgi:pimeloyl-ACP methyl ester carboxylesterase
MAKAPWDTFDLVGYSGGRASVLAFADKHPQRLLSLTLLEPAWAGDWDWSKAHSRLWKLLRTSSRFRLGSTWRRSRGWE